MAEGRWQGFDAIHASPPCQAFSQATRNLWGAARAAETHPDLIAPTREALDATGLPYVIENVPNAPLKAQLLLCGTMFGDTDVRKHRYFEGNWPMPMAPFSCGDHSTLYNPWKGAPGVRTAEKHRAAMGIDWLPEAGGASRKQAVRTGADLNEAIPPAYTEYIGRALIAQLQQVAA
jgi:DNA (cytosine-5)-methyltransferase 1